MEPERAAIIDEYGELERQVAAVAPQKRRLELLGKQIQSWAANEPADREIEYSGKRYTVQLSARKNERRISDMARVFVLFGKKRFLETARVTLEAIDRFLEPSHVREVVSEERTGSRSLKAVAKASPAALVEMQPTRKAQSTSRRKRAA